MRYLVTFLLALGLAADARATLVSVDLATPGDGLITRDTESGLDWLDTTHTTGLSYNAVVPLLYPDGWTHASFAQVCGLVEQVFAGACALRGGEVTLYPGVDAAWFMDLLGRTTALTTEALALPSDPDLFPGPYLFVTGIADREADGFGIAVEAFGLPFLHDDDGPGLGHFLVRPSSYVPEPGTAALLAAGLLALAARRRSRLCATTSGFRL